MKKRGKGLWFILLIVLVTILCQNRGFAQDNAFILTREQNREWFETLSKMNTPEQLAIIKARIIQDSQVYNTNEIKRDLIVIEKELIANRLQEKGNIAEGRILYFARYNGIFKKKRDLEPFQWNNSTTSDKILVFYNLLDSNRINNIELIYEPKETTDIFGSAGGFGVIILDLKSRKDLKSFRAIN